MPSDSKEDKIKKCRDRHHAGQRYTGSEAKGWKCSGCQQKIAVEDFIALGGVVTPDGMKFLS